MIEEDSTVKLIGKAVIFDQSAGLELSKRLQPSCLWMIKLSATMTWIGGFFGFYMGAKQKSRIFLAENCHRLPTLKGGWLKYHQEKQRQMILAGLKSGLKTGLRWGLAAGIFTSLEWGWEEILNVAPRFDDKIVKVLHERDLEQAVKSLLPGPLAGICSGSLFAIYNKLWYSSSRRVVFFGAVFGTGLSILEQANIYIYSKSIKRFD
jgi:hypothetical protein